MTKKNLNPPPFIPHPKSAVKHYTSEPEVYNGKKTVVPGLAPSIETLMSRMRAGIPANIATRSLESFYLGMDLTDVDELSHAYKKLKNSVQDKQKALDDLKRKAFEQSKLERENILKFIEDQKKAVEAAKP